MAYGYFDDANREYVITDPRTPVKWINYIGTLNFGGFVDQLGSGVICRKDPAINRIVKYIPQLPASDMNGETLYIRLHTDSGYKIFSPFWAPTMDEWDSYECHVGLGYNRYITEFYGLKTEITVFVPQGENCVVRDIRVTNTTDRPVRLDLIPVVEYTHFDALKQFTNADWVPQTMQCRLHEEEGQPGIVSQYAFMMKGEAENYFTACRAFSSFETDRETFLGNRGYGSWKAPASLTEDELSCTQANRGNNISALMIPLPVLEPGQERRTITLLGQDDSLSDSLPTIRKFRDFDHVDQAFARIKEFWKGYLDVMQVTTPSDEFNAMVNVHNPRQSYMTLNWSRYLSLYQLGLGARGIGFRDSSQDVLSALGGAPDESKALLKKLLSVQCRNGSAKHQFNPVTMEANEGDSREEEDRPDYYGDDHLWIVLAVCDYIAETGDTDFLKEPIPWYDDKESSPSVLDHLAASLAFTRSDLGAHGLPLLGFADWNDTVNLPTGAESVFNANLYGTALNRMIPLMEYLGRIEEAQTYRTWHREMGEAVNTAAWDGDWYIRYFDARQNPVGSRKNSAGQIFTNAQSWSVMSGFAPEPRALKALDSVRERLNTKHGIKLSTPGYNGYDPEIGGVTTYPPGAKENGGIFLHSNPWVIIAETIMGRGDRAFEYYNQINPAVKDTEVYESEPYCYAQNILGDEHPQFGLGRNSWLSGTSSWMYRAATQHILGIRPRLEGLEIDPCIPTRWKEFSLRRQFRGCLYIIEVKNPDSVSKGIKSILMDGKKIEGKVLPLCTAEECRVEVVMGLG
ncbi:MAG: glycosyl transferase [Spirochaetales bacterium]|nr:glycosyl transferase [Spirochaetales bacterium]